MGRKMRRFDYSFIKDLRISVNIMSSVNRIELSRSMEAERKKSNGDVFSALESFARMQSIKGSNAIEGISTNDERMKEILNKNSAPLSHDEEEIKGYRDALDMIHNGHGSMDISERMIKDLHRVMLSYTNEQGGAYKTSNNLIAKVDREGYKEIIFRPVISEKTPMAMEQLILAYTVAAQDAGINKMILIPCFILDFLCIHPFTDGNGRVSRLLSLMLMYNNGMDVGKYISFEGQINDNKDLYYNALNASSTDWHINGNDYVPFIQNFIFTLSSCYKELNERFTVVGDKKFNKVNRIEATVLNSLIPISKKKISELLPDVSLRTIESKLSEMIKEDKIKKIGSYKDARYVRT